MIKKKIRIHIGDYHASKNPAVIQTLLGSCVAVCLLDPERGIGGMNHILLPGKADLKHCVSETDSIREDYENCLGRKKAVWRN